MNEWNVRDLKKIRIEGFQIHKLISLCTDQNISFRRIQVIDDCSVDAVISAPDLELIRHFAGNRFRITVTGEFGLKHAICSYLSRTATCVGLICFCLILYVQSCYISEIRITGCERLTEAEVLAALDRLGFRVGALKSYDVSDVKTRIFHELDSITWVGINFEGTMAKVEILEGSRVPPLEDTSFPADIVSDKEGYLEQVIVKEGVAVKERGDYFASGDVLISGTVPITDKTYQRDESELIRYVHAQGTVKGRILYRWTWFQPRYSVVRETTGRKIPGMSICIGSWNFDSGNLIQPWETANRSVRKEWNFLRPVPVKVQIYLNEEIQQIRAEREEEEITTLAEQQIRSKIKENLPKDAQIIKKDLSFSKKENIIELNVLVYSLESVGIDQPIPQ